MSGSPLKNLDMFGKLCGDGATKNIVLATTMWEGVTAKVGNGREIELKDIFWRDMLRLGSTAKRFMRTHESAWEIMDSLTNKGPAQLLLQDELVNLHLHLGQTQAGKTSHNELKGKLAKQQGDMHNLLRQQEKAKKENNEQLVAMLAMQREVLEEALQNTFDQITKWKVPLGKRITTFFSLKTAQSVGVLC
jgi:hypothetical protein